MNCRIVLPTSIGFGYRFHHPGRASHVDSPHPVHIQNSRALWIDHKRQVYNRDWLHFAHQQQHLSRAFFVSQINRHELINRRMRGRRDIDAHHLVI